MLAYGATFRLAGPSGERLVPAADYFTMPTLQNVRTENVLAQRAADPRDPARARRPESGLRGPLQTSRDWPIAFAVPLTMNSLRAIRAW
jgi:hypothetical protein